MAPTSLEQDPSRDPGRSARFAVGNILHPHISKTKMALGILVAGSVLAGALIIADKLGIHTSSGVTSEESGNLNPDSTQAKVVEMEPIDFRCFVYVKSAVAPEIKYRHRTTVKVLGVKHTQTTDTSTLSLVDYEGDTDMCVDAKDTKIERIPYTEMVGNKPVEMEKAVITIGNLSARRPRIDHDGKGYVHRDLSGFEKARQIGNPNHLAYAEEGLLLIGQQAIGAQSCVDKGAEVAKKKIQSAYEVEATAYGYDKVEIHYDHVDTPGDIPVGENIDKQLSKSGIIIPDEYDVSMLAPSCDVTLIDGKPAVAGN